MSLRGLLSAPGIGASDADINRYYADSSNGTAALIWVQVLVFATIAFLWFVGVVRGRLGDREPKLFGTVFLGASILLAGLLFLAASFLAAPAVLVAVGGRAPAPDSVALSRAAAGVVPSVFAPRVATLVMFATAGLGRATGALPRWLVWLTYAVGLVELLNSTTAVPTIYLVPAWIAVVSVVLLVRRPPPASIWNQSPRHPDDGEPVTVGAGEFRSTGVYISSGDRIRSAHGSAERSAHHDRRGALPAPVRDSCGGRIPTHPAHRSGPYP